MAIARQVLVLAAVGDVKLLVAAAMTVVAQPNGDLQVRVVQRGGSSGTPASVSSSMA